jgi:hypothetical protein
MYVLKVNGTLLKVDIQFSRNYFCLLIPIYTILGVLVAYIKTLLEIATRIYVTKVKDNVAINRKSVYLNKFRLLCPIDTDLSVLVAYIKRQPGNARSKVKITFLFESFKKINLS